MKSNNHFSSLNNLTLILSLAILWYGYLDIKESLMPAPSHDVEDLARVLYDKVVLLTHEEQLQAQRDIANRADIELSREYGALSPSAKLEFWLLLAQGMESGDIVNVPDNYTLPEHSQEFMSTFKALEFEQQINFVRNAVSKMGLNPSIV
jgi:hypothetical protein